MCIKCPFWNLNSFYWGMWFILGRFPCPSPQIQIWSESQCVIQLIWCPLLSVTSHDGQGWAHHPSPASHWSPHSLVTSHWLLIAHHLDSWLTGLATWDYTTWELLSISSIPWSLGATCGGDSDMWWCHQSHKSVKIMQKNTAAVISWPGPCHSWLSMVRSNCRQLMHIFHLVIYDW